MVSAMPLMYFFYIDIIYRISGEGFYLFIVVSAVLCFFFVFVFFCFFF